MASSLSLLRLWGTLSLPEDSSSPFHLAYTCGQLKCPLYKASLGHPRLYSVVPLQLMYFHSTHLDSKFVHYSSKLEAPKTHWPCFSSFPALSAAPSIWHTAEYTVFSDKWLQKSESKMEGSMSVNKYLFYSSCLSFHLVFQLEWLVTGEGDRGISSLKMSYPTALKIPRPAPLTPHIHTEVALQLPLFDLDLHVWWLSPMSEKWKGRGDEFMAHKAALALVHPAP